MDTSYTDTTTPEEAMKFLLVETHNHKVRQQPPMQRGPVSDLALAKAA
jgi:hypothetical protein